MPTSPYHGDPDWEGSPNVLSRSIDRRPLYARVSESYILTCKSIPLFQALSLSRYAINAPRRRVWICLIHVYVFDLLFMDMDT